ncbi:MAG TPA: DUF3857 domain-containing protein [Thermoanaerobaculia bacterium]|nr:DUF3857 domain-containing protein [Thermoanaerobaculia bacterium]
MSPSRLAAAVLALIPLALFAADEPWDAPPFTSDPKALVAAAEQVPAADSSVIVLLSDTTWTFESDGRFRAVERPLLRVVDEQGIEDAATVSTPWAPWYHDRPAIDARVVTKDGTVHKLDASTITDAPAGQASLDIFSDERQVRAPLPGVAAGSVIEYVITHSGKSPIEGAGDVRMLESAGYFPIHRFRLTIDTPAQLEPRIVNESAIKPAIATRDGRRRTTFEKNDIAALKDVEWGLPFDQWPYPYIAVSTGTSWQDVARRYAGIVDGQIAGSDLKKLVASIIGTATDRQEIAARLLAAIQKDIHYAGFEVGAGSIVPRSPRTVLANKYGDCKDKATLLVAMLREAGLPAHVVLLRSGNDLDVFADLPGLGRFNHAIVVVDGETKFWIDPTDEYARAGELPQDDQGRMVLIADAATTTLTRTPEAPADANVTIETRTVTLPEHGHGSFAEVTETKGAVDSSMRRWVATTDRKEFRESMEKYGKSYYVAKIVKKIDVTDPRDLSKPFLLTIEVDDAGSSDVDGGEGLVGIHPSGLFSNLPEDLEPDGGDDPDDRKPRVHDFVFWRPYAKEWRYRIAPPEGYVARTLPENETKKLGTAMFSRTYSVEPNGTIVATLRFDSGKRRITGAEYEEMRTAVKKVKNGDRVLLAMDQLAQIKLSAGDVAAGLAELRRLTALHPKEAEHHIQLANALISAGLGDPAREEARIAVRLEPKNARAHESLGTVLQFDLLGRRMRDGFDYAGAAASLRKSKELDPKVVRVRTGLVDLLSRGTDGVPYGRDARPDEAIQECRALLKELGDDAKGSQPLLLPLFARTGRYAELKEFAATIDSAQQRDLGRIAAAALVDGIPAAQRELSSFDPATRRQYAAGVAKFLMQLRLYPLAIEMFDIAAQGSTDAAGVRALMDMLRMTKRIEDRPLPPSDPASVVYRFFLAGFHHDEAGIKATFVETGQTLDTKKSRERDRRDAFGWLERLSRNDEMPASALLDMVFSVLRVQKDGDDNAGYRVRLRYEGPAAAPEKSSFSLFVTKEADGYRIRAVDNPPGPFAMTVLQFADAGKLDAARTWLNWAREDAKSGSTDDPLTGSAFAAIWPKSKTTATLDEIRVAAAALMIHEGYESKSAPILVAARETASDDLKPKIDAALLNIYTTEQSWDKAVPVAQRLFAAYPDSRFAFNSYTTVLTNAGKHAEAAALANKRLEQLPKDSDALRALSDSAIQNGDFAAAEKFLLRIIDEQSPTTNDYNGMAWLALFTGNELDRAIGFARRAVGDDKAPDSASLHTLAALLAETGKGVEAREVLLRRLEVGSSSRPNSDDWYVLGRIAEDFGVSDAALAAYKRVEKSTSVRKTTSYELTARRMSALTSSAKLAGP